MEWVLHVIGALIGAAFGATAANNFSMRREFRKDTIALLTKIINDIHTFRRCLLRHFTLDQEFDLANNLVDIRDNQSSWENDAKRDKAMEQVAKLRVECLEAHDKYHDAIGTLVADMVAVEMMFERRGKELLVVIAEFHSCQPIKGGNLPNFETETLLPLLTRAHNAIRDLWKESKSWTAVDWAS